MTSWLEEPSRDLICTRDPNNGKEMDGQRLEIPVSTLIKPNDTWVNNIKPPDIVVCVCTINQFRTTRETCLGNPGNL